MLNNVVGYLSGSGTYIRLALYLGGGLYLVLVYVVEAYLGGGGL
jgi:hypothetical protein